MGLLSDHVSFGTVGRRAGWATGRCTRPTAGVGAPSWQLERTIKECNYKCWQSWNISFVKSLKLHVGLVDHMVISEHLITCTDMQGIKSQSVAEFFIF
jgi:hypothetical protein